MCEAAVVPTVGIVARLGDARGFGAATSARRAGRGVMEPKGTPMAITEEARAAQERAGGLEDAHEARKQLETDLDAMTRLHKISAMFLPERSPLGPVLTEIVDAAIALSGADFGNIQILDPRTSELAIAAQRGFPVWWLAFWDSVAPGQGTRGTALERGERVIIEDVEQSPRFAGTPALETQRRAGVRAVQSTPLITRSGKPIGIFSTYYKAPHRPEERALQRLDLLARQAADIIERAQIEEALGVSEHRYATIFQISPFAIALTRMPEGVTVDVNDAFLKLFEYTREEILGKTSVDLRISDPDSRAWLRAELVARGSVRDFECTRTTKSGARHALSLNLDWVYIDGTQHVLTAAIDITERKESEAQQRRLTEQLAELNRDLERRVGERTDELRRARERAEAASAAKTEFLSSMSHELRTPLTAILGFAQLLERDRKSPLDPRQRERLQHVVRGGEHLARLIEDVLDLSRIEAGRIMISLAPVNVHDVLDEVITTLAPMAARAEIAIAPLPPIALCVAADRTRLTQILLNLGSNAIKYGKPGGQVAFVAAPRDPETVQIAVIDDGIGIPTAKHEQLFEPFQRAGQETGPIEGTGIGLTITKRLVEMMHGHVGFSSEVDRGSRFWIELPADRHAMEERLPGTGAASVAAHPIGAGPHKIVYVEDNPSNIAFMKAFVGDLPGVELVTTPNAELGLDLIRAHRPDVVILDINLPGMNGFDAMLPVIGLSAAALLTDTKRAADAGFFRYLTKPVKVSELTRALEELLGRR
jgi:PAS domain S-box-containing protein